LFLFIFIEAAVVFQSDRRMKVSHWCDSIGSEGTQLSGINLPSVSGVMIY